MKIGFLNIEEQVIGISEIYISSSLNKIKLKEEFSFSIEFYVPDEEEGGQYPYFSYTEIILPNAKNISELINKEMCLNFPLLEQPGYTTPFSYEEDQPLEVLSLTFCIEKNEGFRIKGQGKSKYLQNRREVQILFEGQVLVDETYEITSFPIEFMKRNKSSIKDLVETFSRIEKQMDYKYNVPFVHVPYEIISQWSDLYRKDYKWFNELYSQTQLIEFEKFNALIRNLLKSEKELSDVPHILKESSWQEVIVLAREIRELM